MPLMNSIFLLYYVYSTSFISLLSSPDVLTSTVRAIRLPDTTGGPSVVARGSPLGVDHVGGPPLSLLTEARTVNEAEIPSPEHVVIEVGSLSPGPRPKTRATGPLPAQGSSTESEDHASPAPGPPPDPALEPFVRTLVERIVGRPLFDPVGRTETPSTDLGSAAPTAFGSTPAPRDMMWSNSMSPVAGLERERPSPVPTLPPTVARPSPRPSGPEDSFWYCAICLSDGMSTTSAADSTADSRGTSDSWSVGEERPRMNVMPPAAPRQQSMGPPPQSVGHQTRNAQHERTPNPEHFITGRCGHRFHKQCFATWFFRELETAANFHSAVVGTATRSAGRLSEDFGGSCPECRESPFLPPGPALFLQEEVRRRRSLMIRAMGGGGGEEQPSGSGGGSGSGGRTTSLLRPSGRLGRLQNRLAPPQSAHRWPWLYRTSGHWHEGKRRLALNLSKNLPKSFQRCFLGLVFCCSRRAARRGRREETLRNRLRLEHGELPERLAFPDTLCCLASLDCGTKIVGVCGPVATYPCVTAGSSPLLFSFSPTCWSTWAAVSCATSAAVHTGRFVLKKIHDRDAIHQQLHIPVQASVDDVLLTKCALLHMLSGCICCVAAALSGRYGDLDMTAPECEATCFRALGEQGAQFGVAYGADSVGGCCCGCAVERLLCGWANDLEEGQVGAGEGRFGADGPGGTPAGGAAGDPASSAVDSGAGGEERIVDVEIGRYTTTDVDV